MRDKQRLLEHCRKAVRPMWDEFEVRRSLLTAIARNFYPAALPALRDSVESLGRETPDIETRLLTTIPLECLRRGAAGFQVNITSPARQWFRFRIKTLDETQGASGIHEAMQYLDALRNAVEDTFQRSGLYSELHKLYTHLLAFNFGCMIVMPDEDAVVRAVTLRPGTYALGVDSSGRVNSVARKFAFTRAQLVEEFGEDNLPEDIKHTHETSDKRWVVNNLIEPNLEDDWQMACEIDKSVAYRSIYWVEGATGHARNGFNSGILRTAGYLLNPIIAPRFTHETGEVYGVGRGEVGLPLAKGLQLLRRDQLFISGNRAEPAVIASADLEPHGLDMGRGGINYVKFGQQANDMVYPVFRNPPDSQEARMDFESMARELSNIFFNDAFATIDSLKYQNGVKTATEVEQLVRENMEALGPVVTALDRDLLDPLVSLVAMYTIMGKRVNYDGQAVDVTQLAHLSDIEYLSTIHLSQRSQELNATQTWMQLVASQAQFSPDVIDNINTDAVTLNFARILGVPERILRGKEEMDAARQARAQQAQMAAQQQQAMVDAQTAKEIGSIPIDGAHGGSKLLEALSGRPVSGGEA